MAEIFRLPQDRFQATYDSLKQAAKKCEDDNSVAPSKGDSPSYLSNCDFAQLSRRERKKLGVEMENQSGTKVFVRKDEMLRKIYSQLSVLDGRDGKNDGKIDLSQAPSQIILQDTAQESLSELIFSQYAMSVFEVEVVLAPAGQRFGGSAFIVGKEKLAEGKYRYLLASNCHVADDPNAQELHWFLRHPSLRGSGPPIEASGVKGHPLADVALMSVDLSIDLPVLKLGNSDLLQPGDAIVSIGNSVGRGLVASEGTVRLPFDGGELSQYSLIRVSIGSVQGNSGGPLFNRQGEVIGINVAHDTRALGIVNFAIPSNRVKKSMEQILADPNSRGVAVGYAGFDSRPLRSEERRFIAPKADSGVWVSTVIEESPAARAGLRPGDILVAVDGDSEKTRIDREIDMYRLESYLLDKKAGEKVRLEVLRGGERLELTLEMETLTYGIADTFHTGLQFAVRDRHQWEERLFHQSQGVIAILDNPKSRLFGNLPNGAVITAIDRTATNNVQEFRSVLREAYQSALKEGRPYLRLDFFTRSFIGEEQDFISLPVTQ